jgi:hypothetical protein
MLTLRNFQLHLHSLPTVKYNLLIADLVTRFTSVSPLQSVEPTSLLEETVYVSLLLWSLYILIGQYFPTLFIICGNLKNIPPFRHIAKFYIHDI